jgi:ketosteroid isomerase-like protein
MGLHPWAVVARRAWDAVSAGDPQAFSDLCVPGVVWHAAGRGSHSGTFTGADAILDYLAGIGEDVERFDSELEDVLVGESRAAILFRVSGRRRGRVLETGFVILLRFEDDRIAELWSVPRDQLGIDEFWA